MKLNINDFCLKATNIGCTGIVFVMLGWLLYMCGGWIIEDIRYKKLQKKEEP